MKQTYQEFLEESTNTVRAKNNLSKSILLATYFAVWIIAMVVFWTMKGNVSDYIFSSVDIMKNAYNHAQKCKYKFFSFECFEQISLNPFSFSKLILVIVF